MTETDYRIEHFDDSFCRYKGRSMYMYGLGENAGRLIERFDAEYGFKGVVISDGTSHPDEFCSKTVITVSEFLGREDADILIIAAQMYSAEEIYLKIEEDCLGRGILLLDMYGTDLLAQHSDLRSQRFIGLFEWLELTKDYDIISFQIAYPFVTEDMFSPGEMHVAALYREYVRILKASGKELIWLTDTYISSKKAESILVSDGLEHDALSFREHNIENTHLERFFRDLRERFPGKRILHAGPILLNDGLIPRICGIDSRLMLPYSRETLLDYRSGYRHSSDEQRLDKDRYLRAIEACDVLTVDLFDTLVMRAVPDPADIVKLALKQSIRNGAIDADAAHRYYAARIRAEQICGKVSDMLDYITGGTGLDKSSVKELLREELETEKRCIELRRPVMELVEYARSRGKQTAVVSDMYLDTAAIEEILESCGCAGFDGVFVSSDVGVDKEGGLLDIAAMKMGVAPGRVLHLGDSPERDIMPARRSGMNSLPIPSVYDMADNDLTDCFRTDPDTDSPGHILRAAVFGIWCMAKYADPFATGQDGDPAIYGRDALAPLLTGWVMWIAEKLAGSGMDKALFVSRDGYILKQLYDMLGEKVSLPGSVYFYTSRRAAFMACQDKDGVSGYAGMFRDRLTETEIRERICGLAAGEDPGTAAKRYRENNIRYFRNSGIEAGSRCALIDFVAAGTCQRLLEEYADFRMTGLYCGRNDVPGTDRCEIIPFVNGETLAERDFLSRYIEAERYLSSPEPSLRSFSDDGGPVFADENRSREEIEEMAKVHKEIKEFFRRFLKTLGDGIRDFQGYGSISADMVCTMYMMSVENSKTRNRYDDWSGLEIR